MKVKRLIMTVLLSVMVLSAAAAAACVGNPPDEKPSTPGEEAGNYYFDASNGIEYNVSLDGIDLYTYYFGNASGFGDYTKEDGVMTFHPVGDAETTVFTAVLSGDVLVVTYNGGEMRFYKQITYTVSFSSEGGSAIDPVTVMNGRSIEKPADPVRPGYTFLGWYTDSAYSKPFLFGSQPVTANTTLYAYWGENVVGQREFTIDFDLNYDGAEALGSVQTIGGKLYQLPADPVRDGYTFNGWWISMYEGEAEDPSERLSYPYAEGMVFESSATLYAYWTENQSGSKLSAPVVSVSGNSISWNGQTGATKSAIRVTGPEGFNAIDKETGSTTEAVDFASAPAGDYVISVTAIASNSGNNSDTTTIYYKNKALASVSLFSVAEPSVLVFNAVEHADRYYITVDCGDKAHKHTMIDLGSSTTYNFYNCAMQEGGIRFTVTAEGEGYASSVSRTFVYNRMLAAIEEFRFDDATETLYWDAIPDAAGYVVSVNGVEYEIGGKTQFCLKNFAPVEGGIVVNVYPRTKGYNAPAASKYVYEKTRLAAPSDFRIEGTILTWSDCNADSYEIRIGTHTFTAETNRFDLASANDKVNWSALESYQITIRAIGAENSLWSDAEDIRYQMMAETVSYEAGVVSWNHVVGADSYEVRVNGGEPISVEGGVNYAEISLTQAGINTVEVRYLQDDAAFSWAKTEVYAYTVTFDTNGGTAVAPQYKAYGDPYDEYETPEKPGYEFDAWYTTPGGPETNGARYEDKTFTESGELVLYAYYAPKTYTVKLDLQGGSLGVTTAEVVFNSMYQWPVPTSNDATKSFGGWWSVPLGTGTQYTDDKGNSLQPWAETREDVTVYAFWQDDVLDYTLLSDDTYSVKAGKKISMVSELTIPVTYRGKMVKEIRGEAFANVTNLTKIRIPNSISFIDYSMLNAFSGCTGLTAFEVYDSGMPVAEIGNYLSSDGALLITELNESTSKLVTTLILFPMAREGSYRIPDEVEIIARQAFAGCSLTEITISAGVSAINADAFNKSTKLTTVVFEDAAAGETAVPLTFGARVFSNCSALREVTLPARLQETSFSKYVLKDPSGTPPSQTVTVSASSVDNPFVGCTSLSAVYVSEGSAYYNSIDGILTDKDKTTIIFAPAKADAIAGEYRIPAGITAIGNGAFLDCNGLTKLTIPNTVTTIGELAFYDCDDIEEVIFEGDGFQPVTIGKYAFRTCNYLTTVTFGDGNLVSEIGAGAFYACTRLSSFTIPANMEYIREQAFRGCSALAEVSFAPNGKTLIFEENVFYQCTALTTFYLPANVAELPGVFSGCTALEKVEVDKDNPYFTDIEGVLFDKNVTKLVFFPLGRGGSYTIPETVTEIATGVFRGNEVLTEIVIGANMEKIGNEAFRGCIELKTVRIEDGDKPLTIEDSAFQQCSSIVTITLPGRVKEIGDYAFYWMDSLRLVQFGEGITEIGEMAVYYNASLERVEIPSTVKEIKEGAFSSNYNLKRVTFAAGSQLETIGNFAFSSSAITEITIPATVKTIGSYAFTAQTNNPTLTTVNFADGTVLETIGGNAFQNHKNLKSIVIPGSVTAIGPYAFSGCSSLASVEFEPGEKDLTIGAPTDYSYIRGSATTYTYYGYSFSGCDLKVVQIPARVTELGQYSFNSNYNLTEITFGSETEKSRLTNIGAGAFYMCRSLKEIVIPNTVRNLPEVTACYANSSSSTVIYRTAIGEKTFYGCYALTSVIFEENGKSEDGVTIGNEAFSACMTLSELYLPARMARYTTTDGETVLEPFAGTSVFSGCKLLTEINIEEGGDVYASKDGIVYNGDFTELVYCPLPRTGVIEVPDTVQKISDNAFYNCSSITGISFGENSELNQIGANAFAYCAGITEMVIPDGVTEIGTYAFRNCTNLTSVTLPRELAEFDNAIFTGCTSLNNINVSAGNEKYQSKDGVVFDADGTTLVYYSSSRKAESYTVPAGVTEIGAKAFYQNTYLKEVILPDGLSVINHTAFRGCTALEKINIPNTVTLIDDAAFYGCSALKTVEFEEGGTLPLVIGSEKNPTGKMENTKIPAKYYYSDVFYSTVSLKSLTLPERTTSIGDRTFYNSGIETIVWPAGVTEIGAKMFEKSALRSITLQVGLKTIGDYAFTNCSKLVSVTLPEGLEELGFFVFSKCTAMTSFSFGDNCTLEELNYGTFAECTSLKSIVLPKSITSILSGSVSSVPSIYSSSAKTAVQGSPFLKCTALESVTFEEGTAITALPNYLFRGTGLKSFQIPGTVKTLGTYLFRDCADLTEVDFSLAPQVTELSNYIFAGCSALEEFEIPDNITKIGNYVFQNCTSLTEMKIPESVTSLGTNIFNGCSNLESLDLSELNTKITALPQSFVQNCIKLTSLEIPAAIKTFGTSCFYGTGFTSFTVPDQVTALPSNIFQNSMLEEIVIHDKVTSIGGNAFRGCVNLPFVEIPDSVKTLGTYAFQDCGSLVSVKLSSSLTTLSNYLFRYCVKLESLEIPASVTSIGNEVFNGCVALKSIEIPEGVTKIGKQTFMGSGLESISFPGSLASIADAAFKNCVDLVSVTLPSGSDYTSVSASLFEGCVNLSSVAFSANVEEIGANAFSGCTALAQVTLPGSLIEIGDSAFEGCVTLSEIMLPGSVELIGDAAFRNCVLLKNVYFSEAVTFIGDYAFAGCVQLAQAVLPDALVSLGAYAFSGTGLKEITLPAGLSVLSEGTFENCAALEKVVLTESISEIGDYAFKNCAKLSEIEILSGVVSLGVNPFFGCASLDTYIIAEESESFMLIDGVLFGADGKTLYSYPAGKEGSYTVADGVTVRPYAFAGADLSELIVSDGATLLDGALAGGTFGSVQLPSSLKTLPNSLFKDAKIGAVTIPSGVTVIGEYAFQGAEIDSIVIPNAVTTISQYAFEGSSLSNLTFESGGTEGLTIGTYAFANCTSLEHLVVPSRVRVAYTSSVTPVDNYAFYGCTSLLDVVFEETPASGGVEGVLRLAQYVFAGCTSLKSAEFPSALGRTTSNVWGIYSYSFDGCVSLESVTFAEPVEGAETYGLGSYLFRGCTSLKQFEIPSWVYSLGAGLFESSGIEELTIPETVTGSIGSYLCRYAENLKKVVYNGGSTTQIAQSAFQGCVSLESVEILNEKIVTFGKNAFDGCVSLKYFVIPERITSVNADAFKGWTSAQTIRIEGGEAQASEWKDGWDNECEATIVFGKN